MEIAEAERKTFDELKSNYRQALISNYHDLVQMGNILKKDPIHKQIVATAKLFRSEEDYNLAESYAWALYRFLIMAFFTFLVLVNHLGSLPMNSADSLTVPFDMTLIGFIGP